jgi:asparagine synthase (glutamine-hydrolysing)
LHSFSIGLEGSPDLAAASKVAKHIKSVHHEIKFTIDEGLNAYRDVIYHLETYDITTIRAATPMYLMSRYIRAQGVKMVLSGEGADEVFAGYLYFHKCPNKEEMQEELVRKVKGLYKFDNLRANKATAAWGVEARVPFLDREFLDYALDIDPANKMCGVNGGGRMEKYILRKAFEGYLPDDILWRQKEQFSDGVGYSWIDSIRARAGDLVSDTDLANAKYRFPINPPQTKEAYYIRQTFHSFFPQNSAAETVPGGPSVACSSATAIKWDENFKKMADCSGRSIAGVHVAAYNDSQRAAATAAVSDKDVDAANLTFCTTFTEEGTVAPSSKKPKV